MANKANRTISTKQENLAPLAYRIDSAASVSGLSRTTIYKLISEGRLQATKVAGRRLIPAASLRALLGVEVLS